MYVVNNTVVSLLGGTARLIDVQAGVTTPALRANTLLVGVTTLTNQAAATLKNHVSAGSPSRRTSTLG